MRRWTNWTGVAGFAAAVWVVLLAGVTTVWGHCDQMDGPVVIDAQAALEEGEVTRVLKWIPAEDEQEIRDAFDRTMVVREQGDEARALADRWFFETLVRVHRASEGVAFTGLNPAGTPVSPGIAAADRALERGSVDELATRIASAVERTIREAFEKANSARAQMDESVEDGRTYVHAYVPFVHYVKHLHEAVEAGPEAHAHAGPQLDDGDGESGGGHHHHADH